MLCDAGRYDGQYTVFGRVTEGLEVVDAIQRAETDSLDRPLADVRILRAEVVREPEVKDKAMKRDAKGKALVLAMSFVLFMGGVFALSMDRGNGRTIVLVFVVLALLAIAARQTIRSLKKKKE